MENLKDFIKCNNPSQNGIADQYFVAEDVTGIVKFVFLLGEKIE